MEPGRAENGWCHESGYVGFVESGIRGGSRWTSTEVGLSPLMRVETVACGRFAQFSVELVRADASADCGREIGSPKTAGIGCGHRWFTGGISGGTTLFRR